ncbi:MAG: DNA translocase FtsK, partial [Erysipelotrichaceae bacterium]|nr:DNA translocase FtsK [Erysipelotrichaceae bacterium]
ELDRMPHLLIAGATGSGKSVCINTIIMSLIMRNHPDDVKLVLVDPKKVEFTPYHDVPHLLWPVVTDNAIASSLLQRIVAIMEERYDVFAAAGVRKINDYNELVEKNNENLEEGQEPMKKMPFIVVIIDELADMMAIAGKEVELSIQRITQLARACGIHLIVATQRPSTDVITGLIKANIPSRISFAVSSSIDSRTILDQTGAERLLGYGDMLYYPQGESAPIRLQGVYVRDDEIVRVTDFLKKEASPDYDDTYFALVNNQKLNGEGSKGRQDDDPMMDQVVEYIRESQKASTSLLQRRFGIGYNRAARLIDALEEAGYIGPVNGSKPREVYLKKDEDGEEE